MVAGCATLQGLKKSGFQEVASKSTCRSTQRSMRWLGGGDKVAHYLDKPHGEYDSPPASECKKCPAMLGGQLNGYNCFIPNYEVIGARSCSNSVQQGIGTILESMRARVENQERR